MTTTQPAYAQSTADLARQVNLSPRFEPISDSYDEPFIEIGEVQAFLWAEPDGTYRVAVWRNDGVGPFQRPDGVIPVSVTVDDVPVWRDPAGEKDGNGKRIVEVRGVAANFTGDELDTLARTAGEAVYGDLHDLSLRQQEMALRAYQAHWAEMDAGDADETNQQPAAHPVDALSHEEQAALLRRIFNLMEYGNAAGAGTPGVVSSPDTAMEIAVEFTNAGITLTDPEV